MACKGVCVVAWHDNLFLPCLHVFFFLPLFLPSFLLFFPPSFRLPGSVLSLLPICLIPLFCPSSSSPFSPPSTHRQGPSTLTSHSHVPLQGQQRQCRSGASRARDCHHRLARRRDTRDSIPTRRSQACLHQLPRLDFLQRDHQVPASANALRARLVLVWPTLGHPDAL